MQQRFACMRKRLFFHSPGGFSLGLAWSHELILFSSGLEATVSKLTRGIDKFNKTGGVFQGLSAGVLKHTFSQCDYALLGTSNTTLDHDPVFVDFTVVRETTHWGDALGRQILFGGARLVIASFSKFVHFLVDFSAVMVSRLTSTGNGIANLRWVPSSDTTNFAQTFVGFTWKTGYAPARNNAFETVTFVDSMGVEHFVLLEDRADGNVLLEQTRCEVNLGRNVPTINLDFHDMCFLLAQLDFLDLGVGNDADDGAMVLDALDFGIKIFFVLRNLFCVLGVRLLLGCVPVLVKATATFLAQVFGPDGSYCAETVGGFFVADDTYDDHRGGFQDRDSIHNILLVHLGPRTIDGSKNVGHPCFVRHESGQMRGSRLIIRGEAADAALMTAGTFLWQETKGPVAGLFKFTVRHDACGSKRIQSIRCVLEQSFSCRESLPHEALPRSSDARVGGRGRMNVASG